MTSGSGDDPFWWLRSDGADPSAPINAGNLAQAEEINSLLGLSGQPATLVEVAQGVARLQVLRSDCDAAKTAVSADETAFIEHFQEVARGHFTVRRLERVYGKNLVRTEYERLAQEH